MAQTGIGQVAAAVAHGTEAEAAMAATAVEAVALEGVLVQELPELTAVKTDKTADLKIQVLWVVQQVLIPVVVVVVQIKVQVLAVTADPESL
jgi:hypothetical protein